MAKQYAYDDKMALTAEEVAEAMKDLVEQSKYGGGSLLEVTKARGEVVGKQRERTDTRTGG